MDHQMSMRLKLWKLATKIRRFRAAMAINTPLAVAA